MLQISNRAAQPDHKWVLRHICSQTAAKINIYLIFLCLPYIGCYGLESNSGNKIDE